MKKKCYIYFVGNSLLFPKVKEFSKSVTVDQVIACIKFENTFFET